MVVVKLGDKVRQLRKAKNISGRKFAILAGLSKTTMDDIENNKVTNSKKDTLNKIAKALGVPTGLLIDEESTLQEIAEDLLQKAKFNGPLSNLSDDARKNMLKEIIIQEPQIFYETTESEGYIGPLGEDEMMALKAYLRLYRETRGSVKNDKDSEKKD
jgi:transcriptional regulator with XRE-family HTH domain